jgi:hypothetical protein
MPSVWQIWAKVGRKTPPSFSSPQPPFSVLCQRIPLHQQLLHVIYVYVKLGRDLERIQSASIVTEGGVKARV